MLTARGSSSGQAGCAVLALVLVLLAGSCSTKTWDGDPIRLVSIDETETCFFVKAEDRDVCVQAENAVPLVDYEPGACAKIDSYKNTGAVDSAEPIDCDEVGIESQ